MKAMHKEELIEKIIKSSSLVSKNEKEELLEYWNNKKLYIKKGIFYLGSDKKTYSDMIFELNDEIVNLQRENKQLSQEVDIWNKKYNEEFDKSKSLITNWNILKGFIDALWLDDNGIVTKIKDKIELIERGDNK